MKKRLVSIFFTALAAAALLSLLSFTAAAETFKYNDKKLEIQTEGDYQFITVPEDALSENDINLGVTAGVYITKFTGTLQSSISIPAKLGGQPVIQIGKQAFKGNNAIQTVTVNSSVKKISSEAFMDCSGLQTVLISKETTQIRDSVFQNCTALKSVTFEKGSKLKKIDNYAFYNCTSLSKFKVPEGVESIGDQVFVDCDSLIDFTIPDSVTNLGSMVFFACNSLQEVTIGNGVTVLKSHHKSYSGFANWGTEKDYPGCFEGCIRLSKVNFGTGIETLDQDCFAGTALTDVTLPDNIKTIGIGAFNNCKALKSFNTGNGVETICASAFENDTALESFKIGKNVLSIKDFAFWNCNALKNIVIPSNVTSLGVAVFFSCDSLETAVIGNGIKELKTYYKAYSSFSNKGTEKDYCGCFEECVNLRSVSIGSAVRTIEQDCFAGTALVEVIVPDNVITLGAGAFCQCPELQKIVIGKGVISMGWSIFENDDKLTDVTVGSGVVTIGDYAFWDCDALEEIYIPSNVTTLGKAAFYMCDNLKTAVIGNGVTDILSNHKSYSSYSNWGSDKDDVGCFEGCVNLLSVTLGSGIISIGQDSFAGTQIERLTVPFKVSTLNKGAFTGATKLKDIYFVGNWATSVGNSLFDNIAPEYKIHYINGRVGYDELTYNKEVFTPVTVKFDNNDEDVFAAPTEDQVMSPAGGYVIEPISPVALGYLFDGWYKDAACTQKWDFKKNQVTKDTTLYAKWLPVDKVKPVRPENVSAGDVSGKTIALRWDEVDGAMSYNVYQDGKKINDSPIIGNQYTADNLSVSTTYEFEVTAVNSMGESPRSLIFAQRTSNHVHTPGEPVKEAEKPATCTEPGSYDSVIYCTDPECGAEISRTTETIPATGHDFGEWQQGNETEHIRYCNHDVTHTETAEHTWDAGKVTKEATETAEGEKTYTCTVCKATKTEPIPKKTPGKVDFLLGDVDGNGIVEAADARLALRAAVGLENYPAGTREFLAADVTKDAQITAEDARLILRAAVGLEKLV